MKQLLFTKGPQGPIGPPWELPWTTFILHLIRYLHTTWLDHSPSGSGEEDVWSLHGFGHLGPSTWAPMGATLTIWTTFNPLPLRMIPATFGWNPTMRFQEEDENVKSLRMMDKTDGNSSPEPKKMEEPTKKVVLVICVQLYKIISYMYMNHF